MSENNYNVKSQADECACAVSTEKCKKFQAYYKKHHAKINLWASFFVTAIVSVLSVTLFLSLDFSNILSMLGSSAPANFEMAEAGVGAFSIVYTLIKMFFASAYTISVQTVTILVAVLAGSVSSIVFLIKGAFSLAKKKPMMLTAVSNIFANLFAMVLVMCISKDQVLTIVGVAMNGFVLAGFIVGGIIIAALVVLNYMYIYDKSTVDLTLRKAISLIVFLTFEILLLWLVVNAGFVRALPILGYGEMTVESIGLFAFCIIYLILILSAFIMISRKLIYGKGKSFSFTAYAAVNLAVCSVIFVFAMMFFGSIGWISFGDSLSPLTGMFVDSYISMFIVSIVALIVAVVLKRNGSDKPKLN